MIRLVAHVYAKSIATHTPLSELWTPPLMYEFYSLVSVVSLQRWKQMPGVFLWILLVACPGCGEDKWGKWVKRKMAVCGMGLGLIDLGLAIGCLREFWRIGRWVRREGMKEENFEHCGDGVETYIELGVQCTV
jgi:hypothetical protein